jgi:hypothetical protein
MDPYALDFPVCHDAARAPGRDERRALMRKVRQTRDAARGAAGKVCACAGEAGKGRSRCALALAGGAVRWGRVTALLLPPERWVSERRAARGAGSWAVTFPTTSRARTTT